MQVLQHPTLTEGSPQDLRDDQTTRSTTIQVRRAPVVDMLLKYVERARQPDSMDNGLPAERRFVRRIRCSVNLLTASQKKSKVVELLASKRALVLKLVELETLYHSLRCELREEEGRDATDAFCREHYGLGDGCDAETELAIAHMELTFKPLRFPGLEIKGSATKGRHY